MKKGKSVKINLYNPIKSTYGTVDSKNLKSVYINIQSWVTPKFEQDNWTRIVGNLNREIKVGYPINIYSTTNIIKGINYVLDYKNKKKLKKNILKFTKICDSKKWVLSFKEVHAKLFA
jgi:hypothetical protein